MNRFSCLMTLTTFVVAATLASATGIAQGQTPKKPAQNVKPSKGPAYVSPPEDDDNFPLMGEFIGQIGDGDDGETKQKLALQIRPVANDRFVAIAYRGGLPGQDPAPPEEMDLIGLRSVESLILSGGPWAIFVDPKGCTLISKQGKKVGRLKRIKRVSPTLGAQPPEGAIVLFDGKNTDNLIGAQVTPNGLLKQGVRVLPMLHDFNLHIEFRLPYMPLAEGQSRGNSGLYLQSRYECQILDSFGTEKVFNGLGALYRQKAPDLNMALPPLTWQTYDVQFTAARWAADGSKIRDAHVTSWVNGVMVQNDVALPTKTGHGKEEEPTLLPTHFQDHGDPVRFQNIWVIDRGLMHAEFPILATKQQQKAASEVGWEDEVVDKTPLPVEEETDTKKTEASEDSAKEKKDKPEADKASVKTAAEKSGEKDEETADDSQAKADEKGDKEPVTQEETDKEDDAE